ncbi:MAG: hypothetical protein EA376_07130 [Phycisphaeraceae bacterium]|nr:MAG: hypothetical protein EA376_07130 [Phycisphaeraceae bacterium]
MFSVEACVGGVMMFLRLTILASGLLSLGAATSVLLAWGIALFVPVHDLVHSRNFNTTLRFPDSDRYQIHCDPPTERFGSDVVMYIKPVLMCGFDYTREILRLRQQIQTLPAIDADHWSISAVNSVSRVAE